MDDKTPGQAAYEAYMKARYSSAAPRPWPVLNAVERAAWEAAATAAVEACGAGS